MTKVIDPVVATYYASTIKVAYQSGAILRPHVRVQTGIVGQTAEFPRISRGMARVHVPASPRVPMDLAYNKATATMSAWSAAAWSDQIEQTRIAFDEPPPLSRACGLAIARRVDQLVIDAMVAAFGAATIVDGGAGMTEPKLRQIARIFDQRGVPRENRKLLVSATVYDQIRSLAVAQNQDFGATAAVRTGVVPPLFGLQVIMIDDARDEGGLPIVSTVRRCFAFDSDAVGLALGAEPALDINWIPERAAWLIEQRFSGGAAVIDPDGVIRVDCVES